MTNMTITDIENAPITDNDELLMQVIHEFVMDDSNPMNERQRALYKLDQVMGEQGDFPDEEAVFNYVDFSS